MDTSPTMPPKKIQLGYVSPFNLSPAVSPLTGNSPLHHSFSTASTASRKSSTLSESTPLSSPSSLNHTNPFAVNYDSGNCEHWQSSSSSVCPSPSAMELKSSSMENESGRPVLRRSISPGIIIMDDHKNLCVMDSSSDFSNEAPTPLSPKGLQFRHKPFPLSLAPIPSPIPSKSGTGFSNLSTSTVTGLNPPKSNTISKHSIHHDKHLSPFNSDLCHMHVPSHPHAHARMIRTSKLRSQLSTCARQMNRLDPLKPPVIALGSSPDHKVQTGPTISKQLAAGVSSPLAKLSMSSSSNNGGLLDESTLLANSSPSILHIEQKMLRGTTRRRESETSNDSLMESDVSSFEESLELCEASKDFEPNIASTTSWSRLLSWRFLFHRAQITSSENWFISMLVYVYTGTHYFCYPVFVTAVLPICMSFLLQYISFGFSVTKSLVLGTPLVTLYYLIFTHSNQSFIPIMYCAPGGWAMGQSYPEGTLIKWNFGDVSCFHVIRKVSFLCSVYSKMSCMRCFCSCIWGNPDPGPVRLRDVQQVVLDTNRMGTVVSVCP